MNLNYRLGFNMEFFRKTNIDFMSLRTHAAFVSLLMVVVCSFSIYQYGIPLGLDFTGGVQIEMRFKDSVDPAAIREQLAPIAMLSDAKVQNIGTSHDLLIRAGASDSKTVSQITQILTKSFPDMTITRNVFIGPQVGGAMFESGLMALLVASLLTLVYITLRFEWRFAVSAILALVHDPILILGLFSVMRIEFDLIGLAALLTVFGYSLNDTIVVYDRVRENFRKYKTIPVGEILNASINQTLSRTIMTSGLTLAVVMALLLFGGDSLQAFSFALVIGILIGTYSSIYVAGAFAMSIGLKRDHLISSRKRATGPMV
tara:strand:+ start:1867 stop:2814 length:948 start_codon:yes stop_codon:yes gene_type:complete